MICSTSTETRIGAGRRPSCWPFFLACALIGGCVTAPPPHNLDLRGMRIVAIAAPPTVDVNGLPGGKAAGAAVGAGTGSGAGVLAGVGVCIATGPLFPLCIAAVVPTTMVVGTATGLVVGAVRTESSAAIAAKTAALKAELLATPFQILLAEELGTRLRSDHRLDVSSPSVVEARPVPLGIDAPTADAPLELLVGVREIGTEGKRTFALRLVTDMVLRRGPSDVVWRTAREVQSDTELTLDHWTASDSKALHGVLDACIRTAARRLVGALARGIAGSPESIAPPGERYSTSCDDHPDDWRQARATP